MLYGMDDNNKCLVTDTFVCTYVPIYTYFETCALIS